MVRLMSFVTVISVVQEVLYQPRFLKRSKCRELPKVRETIAAAAMRVSHEPTETELADLLSKILQASDTAC